MDRPGLLRIGALAGAAGVGVETIRYYQARKLIGTPPKPLGGQRLYPSDYVERLRFIKRAQGLGFSLDEIESLLKLNDGTDHVRARRLAVARLEEVEARIADLEKVRGSLRRLVRECEHAASRRVACPIIRAVVADDAKGVTPRGRAASARTPRARSRPSRSAA